ncbi:MAG TPA: hypothetical protein VGE97_01065 [Nitrososphaera sp.]|jgi:hypothetical protein
MNKNTIHYGVVACIVALAVSVTYAVVRLYVLSQRVDLSILVVNVIAFGAISAFLLYLMKKEKDLRDEDFFRD